MAQNFQAGLFSPSSAPVGGTKSNVPLSGIQAISKATTLQDENPFDSITQPLRQRKRRKVAEQLHAEGVEIDTPEYYEKFRNKLVEFGDNEGVEIITEKMKEAAATALDARVKTTGIKNVEGQIDSREKKDILDRDQFGLKQLKNQSDIDTARGNLEIAGRNATTNEAKARVAELNSALDAREVVIKEAKLAPELAGIRAKTNNLNASTDKLKAETDSTTVETAFLNKHGALPGKQDLNSAATVNNMKVSKARTLIKQLKKNLTDASAAEQKQPGWSAFGISVPGDDISGFEGSVKSAWSGVIRQLTGKDIKTDATSQRQAYEYLGTLLVPVLLGEKRVSDPDRARVEIIVGRLKAASDNKQQQAELDNLLGFIDDMPDKTNLEDMDDEDLFN